MVPTTWPQALAWRMGRQLLDPVGSGSATDVVQALGAVPGQYDDSAELAVGLRRTTSGPDDLARALADGELVSTFAFRGAVHLMTPHDAAAYLALRASSRMWELPSWQSHYGLAPADWPGFRAAVREALADGPLTFSELGAALTAQAAFRTVPISWTLLKALAWQGDLSFGPRRDGAATFQLLDTNPRWTGLAELDEAGRRAVESYVRAYGPTTADQVQQWLGGGLGAGRKRIRGWLTDLDDRLTEIDVDGAPRLLLRDDVDALLATPPSTSVRLLPRYDQWVLGPGTADSHVVPPAHRDPVSRGANVVLVGGVVSGTWARTDGEVVVTWFPDTPPRPRDALDAEAERLATIVDRPLRLEPAGVDSPSGA